MSSAKVKLKLLLVTAIVGFFNRSINAQELVQVPNAPEAAIAQKFVDIPVDMYTGIPSISVPIYTLQGRDIGLPISLNYHAGGIRVSEESSCVGLGWNLSAGGMITREIRGYDDFGGVTSDNKATRSYINSRDDLPSPPDQQSGITYFDLDNTAAIMTGSGCPFQCNFTTESGTSSDDIFCPDLQVQLDPQPDLYTFSFAGYSGKFIINENDEFVPISDHAMKIELIPGTDPSWKIITPDGTKYFFGEDASAIQRTYSKSRTITSPIFGGQPNPRGGASSQDDAVEVSNITTWYLNRVISANGDEIDLTYSKTLRGVTALPTYSESRSDRMKVCSHVASSGAPLPCNISPPDVPQGSFHKIVTRTWYDLVTLTEINHDYGKVVFNHMLNRDDLNGGSRLETIDIYYPALIKSFVLEHDYFVSSPSDFDWDTPENIDPAYSTDFGPDLDNNRYKRLKLDKVFEVGGTETPLEYQFNYNGLSLPSKTSMSIDTWGHYNGADNTCLIPQQSIVDYTTFPDCDNNANDPMEFFIDGGNRRANNDMAKAGILNRVKYPTGGTLDLIYESNEFDLEPVPIPIGTPTVNVYRINPGNTGDPGSIQVQPSMTFEIGSVRPEDMMTAMTKIRGEWVLEENCTTCNLTDNCEGQFNSADEIFKMEIWTEEVPTTQVYSHNFQSTELFSGKYFEEFQIELPPGMYRLEIKPIDGCTTYSNSITTAEIFLDYMNYEILESDIGGGIRVAETSLDDGKGTVITKKYNYSNNGETNGVLMNKPSFSQVNTSEDATDDNCNGEFAYVIYSTLETSSNSRVPLRNSFAGSFVGYTEVTQNHGAAAENGYSIYEFFNRGTSTQRSLFQYYLPPQLPRFYDMRNGKLLSRRDYNASGVMVHEQVNQYTKAAGFDPIWSCYPQLSSRTDGILQNRPCGAFFTIYYYAIIPQWIQLTSTTDSYFGSDGSGPATKITDYTYDNSNYEIKSASFTNSDGRVYKTIYSYPHDFGYSFMTDPAVNWLNKIIQTEEQVGGITRHGSQTTYQLDGGKIVPHRVFKYEGNTWDLVGEYGDYQGTVFPGKFNKNRYVDDEIYEWTNGLLSKKTYSDFEWSMDYYYDGNRKLKSLTNPDQTRSEFVYDDLQRLYQVKQMGISGAQKSLTEIIYGYGDPANDENFTRTKIEFSDGTPDRIEFKYFDGLGRHYQTLKKDYIHGNDVKTEEYTFDDHGRIESQLYLPGSTTSLQYYDSPLNRLKEETYPDGASMVYAYGVSGNLLTTEVTDENGHLTTTFAEFVDRNKKIVNALGDETVWEYDDWGHVLTITTPEGKLFEYEYDNADYLLMSKKVPGANEMVYTYDDKDRLKTEMDGNSIVLEYAYDQYDRIETVKKNGQIITTNVYGDGINAPRTQIRSAEHLMLTDQSTVSRIYTYDDFARVEDEQVSSTFGTYSMAYLYDNADQLETETTTLPGSDWKHCEYTYDRWGRQETMSVSSSKTGAMQVSENVYNMRDELISKNLGDGLQSLDYLYHERGWLSQINQPLPSSSFPTCGTSSIFAELPEQVENDPFIHMSQDMTLEEILNARFFTDININDFEQDCNACQDLSCDPIEIADQALSLDAITMRTDSIFRSTKTIPCEDGEDAEIDVINYENFYLPFVINRVKLCDGTEVYVLEDYLYLLMGDYQIVQSIHVLDLSQMFDVVRSDESTVSLTLEELMLFMIEGEPIKINGYVDCETEQCTGGTSGCTNQEIGAQEAALEELQSAWESMNPEDIQYPITLYRIGLCGGSYMYVTQDELAYFDNVDFEIEDQIDVTSPDEPLLTGMDPMTAEDLNDLFYLKLHYNGGLLGSAEQKNGNISGMEWQVQGQAKHGYGFTYDPLDRLKLANYGLLKGSGGSLTSSLRGEGYTVSGINYSADGNIESLTRWGPVAECGENIEFGEIDILGYTYNAMDQLGGVTDGASGDGAELGFYPGSGGNYSYDLAGNLMSDPNKSLSFTYNHLNLPETITGPGGGIINNYDASGTKWRHESTIGGDNIQYDYIGGAEYRDGNLIAIYHAEGRIANDGEGWKHEFHIRDHLGNTRVIFSDRNGDGSITQSEEDSELLEEAHYYPFGLRMEGPWITRETDDQNEHYLYNGKELYDQGFDTDGDGEKNYIVGLYDYGARFYDPAISRFTSIDPLVSDFPNWSPYAYTFNNPIRYTDPTGMAPDDIILRGSNNTSVTIKTDLIDIDLDASRLVGDLGGNYTLEGGDIVDAALDIGGLFDPTGAVDATAAVYHGSEGNIGSAVISGLSVLPGGDLFKVAKAGKHVKTIKKAIDAVHGNSKLSQKAQHGYEIFNKKTGDILEYGISGQRRSAKQISLDGSPRINQKLRTKYGNDPDIGGRVIDGKLGNRQNALDWERGKVQEFRRNNNNQKPPRQIRPN